MINENLQNLYHALKIAISPQNEKEIEEILGNNNNLVNTSLQSFIMQ